MYRAVYATAPHQRRIGCVDDCLNLLTRDVSDQNFHASIQKRLFVVPRHFILVQTGTGKTRYLFTLFLRNGIARLNLNLVKHVLPSQGLGNAFSFVLGQRVLGVGARNLE